MKRSKQSKQKLDAVLDATLEGIRRERVTRSAVDEAAARVWARVSAQASSAQAQAVAVPPVEHIRGCSDFQSLMPAYLRDELTSARRLLLEDHTHECIPCRKALREAREGGRTAAARAAKLPVRSAWTLTPAWRMALAASVVALIGVAALFVLQRIPYGQALAATIESANGAIYRVTGTGVTVASEGEKIKTGERVRVAKDAGAVLKLTDGSRVELRARSEFYVTENAGGITIQLERGDAIIEAAKQKDKHLYVQTPDSLVSVKGTIFAVASGTKGSRVSVVEGEVRMNHASTEQILLPGDQATTSASLERTSVQQEVAWSRNAAKYAKLVSDLSALRHDLNQSAPRPGVRYSSRFLELVPENTVLYAALPNFSEQLAASHKIMQERISQNPALAEWWKSRHHDGPGGGLDDVVIERIREFGSHLGDEIVIAAGVDARRGEPSGILVLGELKDATTFRPFVEKQLAELSKDGKGGARVRFLDDPLTAEVSDAATGATETANAATTKSDAKATAGAKSIAKAAGAQDAPRRDEVYIWVSNDLFAASPQVEALRALETSMKSPGANRFATTSFHQRLAEVYREGAGLIVAADLEKIIGQALAREGAGKPDAARRMEGYRQLGLLSLKHFVVEQKDVNQKTQSRAVLTFDEPRRGIASWLAAPGPMGALEFISPNANMATAFVVKEPTLLVDDLFGFMETVAPEVRKQLRDVEAQQGFDIKRDFAAPLGGEFAFAVDGPILPTPSWKMIVEVYDQQRLQQTFERAVDKLNAWAAQHGQGGLRWENTNEGGQTYYTLRSVDFGFEVNYTYSNGYLIAGPTRALVQRALQYREAGYTLVRSPRFASALPEDGNTNFSAVFYHDLAPLLQPLADQVGSVAGAVAGQMSEKDRQMLAAFAANTPPTLAYVYAQGDRITVAANTEGGPFGLGPAAALGLPNALEVQSVLMRAVDGKSEAQRLKAIDDRVREADEKMKAADARAQAADEERAAKR